MYCTASSFIHKYIPTCFTVYRVTRAVTGGHMRKKEHTFRRGQLVRWRKTKNPAITKQIRICKVFLKEGPFRVVSVEDNDAFFTNYFGHSQILELRYDADLTPVVFKGSQKFSGAFFEPVNP